MANELVKAGEPQSYLPKLPEGRYDYPSELIDPKVKNTKEYVLKYLKAGYYHYSENRCLITSSIRAEWIEKRQYADGNQSNLKYATRLSRLRDSQNQVVSYNDLDQRLLKTIPEFIDIIFSNLDKIDYDIFCDSIHPEAHLEREEMKWGLWTEAQMKPFFDEMSAKAKVPLNGTSETLPKSLQELDLMMQYSVRLNEEMQMELGQQMVLYENDFKETRKQLLHDAIKLAVMFSSVEIDRISGRVHVQYEDPVNAILEDFRGHKGKMQRRGVFRKMTVAQLMLKAGSQFTREQYFEIAKSGCGKWGNPENIGSYGDYINTDATYNQTYLHWENNTIYVMDYEWDTCDRLKFERKNVYGNEMIYEKKFTEPLGKKTSVGEDGLLYEKEVYATDIKTIYGGQWVIGTEFIFDYGKRVNIPRPNENQKECYGKFRFYRVANTSILDRMLPYIDAMQLKWLRIQNVIARAIPSGFIIKQDALMNVMIDDKIKSQKELMEMLFQTGILVVSNSTTLDDDSPNLSTRPIERFEADIGVELTGLYNGIIADRNSLKADTGINDFMNSATPNANALVGVAEMAVVNAQNAIYPILSGFIAHHEDICTGITLNLQLLTRYKGKLSGYVPSLGQAGTKFVEITNDIDRTVHNTPTMYGIRIQARATQEQKQRMMNYIDAAIANSQSPEGGGLDITDGIELSRLINNGTNLKLVVAIMGQRIEKRKEALHAKDMEKIKAQGEEITAQTQTANEETRKTKEFEFSLEARLEKIRADEKIRVLKEEWKFKVAHEVTKGRMKEDLEVTKTAGKIEIEESKPVKVAAK